MTAPLGMAQDQLVILWVMNADSADGPPEPIVAATGLTLEMITSIAVEGTADHRLTGFRAVGGAASIGAVAISFLRAQDACAWSAVSYTGFDNSGANGSNAIVQFKTATDDGSQLRLPLATLADAMRSMICGAIVLRTSRAIDPASGLTELHEEQLPAPRAGTLQTADRIAGGELLRWSWTGNDSAAAIAIEIRPAPLPVERPESEAEKLARKFEPILMMHPGEPIFPADAKRYIENCALWKSAPPFDDKNFWGDTSQSLPRFPEINKLMIRAGRDEVGGTPINAPIVDRESFLEFAGWIDDPGVTQTSKNDFANRQRVLNAYMQDDAEGGVAALRNSRFWYHAEFIENARLESLLKKTASPDLHKVLKQRKNAALLNYYFFFPYHEEGLLDCANDETGINFASFGGEWQCLSLLLERDDPAGEFEPTFVGVTGRLLTSLPPKTEQVTDSSDLAERQTMRVTHFDQVDMSLGHPLVFVAKGTHSLYLRPGNVTNVGYPDQKIPQKCGRFEGPVPIHVPPSPGRKDDNSAVLLAKMAALAAVGGPLGFIFGAFWALIELVQTMGSGSLLFINSTFDDPSPDKTGSQGNEIVIKPRSVTFPFTGQEVHNWESSQGVEIDGRRYDSMVDRSAQLWWQSDTDEGGFPGRWGPRVQHDQFDRRAGMRFPKYWQLFFLALSTGIAKKIL